MGIAVNIFLKEEHFFTMFFVEKNTEEYEIADKAYEISLEFAQTRASLTYGDDYSPEQLATVLADLDYSYDMIELGD